MHFSSGWEAKATFHLSASADLFGRVSADDEIAFECFSL